LDIFRKQFAKPPQRQSKKRPELNSDLMNKSQVNFVYHKEDDSEKPVS
jgi:hypothetical protein